MALGSPQERRFESLHIAIAHAEFGNLKPQQLKEMSHARKHGYWQNSGAVPGNDGRNQLLTRYKIFNEGRVLRQSGLEFFQREVGGRFESRVFPLVRRQLA